MPPPLSPHSLSPPSCANYRCFAIFATFLLALLLLPHHIACLPPAPTRCAPCLEDNTCGENNAFVCKEGLCVSRDNPDPKQCASEQTDGGSEKTEPLPENLPEEALFPEDGAPSDGEALHEQDPEVGLLCEDAGVGLLCEAGLWGGFAL
ncbi:hypothetical protein L6R29_23335 [Myxococcota bacterium]|nr:hypothetical protein [Myxococcota bacterium]